MDFFLCTNEANIASSNTGMVRPTTMSNNLKILVCVGYCRKYLSLVTLTNKNVFHYSYWEVSGERPFPASPQHHHVGEC